MVSGISLTTGCLADIGVRAVYDGLVVCAFRLCHLLGVSVIALGQLYVLLTLFSV